MVYRRITLVVVLGAVLFAPSAVHGDDVGDLKASFEQTITAYNTRDLDALVAGQHDHLMYFGPFAPSSLKGKDAVWQAFQTLFASYESVTFTTFDPQFHASGTTGEAWGFANVRLKPKNGPLATSFFRYSWTYTKSGEQWLRVP